jgi:hypothetical protein
MRISYNYYPIFYPPLPLGSQHKCGLLECPRNRVSY